MTRAEERLMLSITSQKCKDDVVSAASSLGLSAVNTGLVPAEAVINAQGFKSMLLSALLLQNDGDKLGQIADIDPIGFNGNAKFNFHYTESHSFEDDFEEITEDSKQSYICDAETKLKLDERFNFEYPFINDTKIPSKMAVTSLVHGEKTAFAFKSRPRFMSKSGLTPAERGTAMHKVMQYFDFEKHNGTHKLVFERLDTYCDIYVNDKYLGHCDNGHIKHEFDVTDVVTDGQNEVKVIFYSPITMVDGKPKLRGAFTTERMYTRRTQCSYGWDWLGRIISSGMNSDVYIEMYDPNEPVIDIIAPNIS
jgi:hypothetical protein